MVQIDPTARIASDAVLSDDVIIEAYAIIGPSATIGARNQFYGHVSVGGPPQDLKYKGERTELAIGNDNVFREFATINRGTFGGGGRTTIASDNYFMAYSHVAHDCHIGSNVIFAN